MKPKAIFEYVDQIRAILVMGVPPTVNAVFSSPRLLLNPTAFSRVFMSYVWAVMADGMDMWAKELKEEIITLNATGIVLDIGAGHGHTVLYLNRSMVDKYIAVEPNTNMHPNIRSNADKRGFHESDGSLIILSQGAEDTQSILASLRDATGIPNTQVDTLVCVRTLCTVPSPQQTLMALVRDILKPEGHFVMYEHVLSKFGDVAWWQWAFAPTWSFVFDGCKLDRPTDVWVEKLKINVDGEERPAWKEGKVWKHEADPPFEDNLFPHLAGVFVKA
ncbi:S-adenosyl-L-methionine-dependent methyltransferase [Gymnopilus junonius]|uniref:S-adenosyl-L-methionine-dependent methyltransferase n=1 Tax=Gymnopilus junonius TaxID=109634 RepID=A0A9P5TJR0_GYMJU|nr:S-adenosyl-L-methionine-dependent methyltransferase [Gymnopilus junonius]